MRTTAVTALLLSLAVASSVHASDVAVRFRGPDEPAPARPAKAAPALTDKLDPLAGTLIVPRFVVDTNDPVGLTTLFAVRNTTNSPLSIDINYASTTGALLRHDDIDLGPRETLTRNVRDVTGLPADGSGIATGFIAVQASMPSGNVLTGDFLQVDVANDFATGDRLVRLLDLCDGGEVRFLDFGSGSDLTFLVNSPQGADPMTDPPSVSMLVLGEDGAVLGTIDVFVVENTFVLNTDDLPLPVAFGTLQLDFSNAGGGLVFVEYSAEGKFSVGMNSACLD